MGAGVSDAGAWLKMTFHYSREQKLFPVTLTLMDSSSGPDRHLHVLHPVASIFYFIIIINAFVKARCTVTLVSWKISSNAHLFIEYSAPARERLTEVAIFFGSGDELLSAITRYLVLQMMMMMMMMYTEEIGWASLTRINQFSRSGHALPYWRSRDKRKGPVSINPRC